MRMTVTQFKGNDDDISPEDAKAQASVMLRAKFAQEQHSLASEPEPTVPKPVVMTGETTWRDSDGKEKADGYVIEWSAEGVPVVTDPPPLEGGQRDDEHGTYRVSLPDEIRLSGGAVRVHHGFGKPVTVSALGTNGQPIGYLFTQDVSPDEEHVEVMAGTAALLVVRDPEPGSAEPEQPLTVKEMPVPQAVQTRKPPTIEGDE